MKKLLELMANYVEFDPSTVTDDTRFIEDLGFNSYDFISLLGEIEDAFGITVDEEEITKLHTVGEASEYINKLKKAK